MKTKRYLIFLAFIFLLFMAWPYYSAWQLMGAVNSGDAEKLKTYINFPKVRRSLLDQVDAKIEQQSENGDGLVAEIAASFRPMIEQLVDTAVRPENIAEFIEQGKLQRSQSTKTGNNPGKNTELKSLPGSTRVSWYAFLDRPTRLKIALDDLVVFMELEQFHWRVTAIGIEDLLSHSSDSQRVAHIADEVDRYPPITPEPVTIDQLRTDIASAFFIENDFSDTFSLQADFYYIPVGNTAEINVEVIDAIDVDGNSVLAEFSEEKKAEREKFNIGRQLNMHSWRDSFPKVDGAKKVDKVLGKASLVVPTKIEKYLLEKQDVNKLQRKELSGVNLTQIQNGKVSLSLYWDFRQDGVNPVVVIRNKKGEVLATSGYSGMSRDKAIKDPRFKLDVRGERREIDVKGTPSSIEVYFPLNLVQVGNDFIAYAKPEMVAGKLDAEIKNTRYDKAVKLPVFINTSKEYLTEAIEYRFLEKKSWDNNWHRSIEVVLPNTPNSELAKVDFDGLRISTLDTESWVDQRSIQTYKNQNIYGAKFLEQNNYDGDPLAIDLATGVIKISYPSRVEKIEVLQGEENKDGVKLVGPKLTYPRGVGYSKYIESLSEVFGIAYDYNGRRIALLKANGFRDRNKHEVYFWGIPEKVELIKVVEWIELDVPKAFRPQDLKKVEAKK